MSPKEEKVEIMPSDFKSCFLSSFGSVTKDLLASEVSFVTLVMNGVTDPVFLSFIVFTSSIFIHSQLYHGNPYLMPCRRSTTLCNYCIIQVY